MPIDYVAINSKQKIAEADKFTAERYRQFSVYMKKGVVQVLDVGCSVGAGGLALKQARPELQLHGLDCLQSRLDQLPPEIYANAVCSFTTSINVPDSSFDAIVAGEFIEHLTYSDGIDTLSEFRRILRPEGQLLMTTPYPDYIRLLLTGRTTVGGAHVSAHYPKQLSVMMQDAGFQGINWRGSGKVTRLIGDRIPIMTLYGSFLIVGSASA